MKPTDKQLDSLNRLWRMANGNSGQCRIVAAFLLGLYNGPRFPFDLTDFRALDASIFMDCIAVLAMDWAPEKEVHEQLGVKSSVFEDLAVAWDIREAA